MVVKNPLTKLVVVQHFQEELEVVHPEEMDSTAVIGLDKVVPVGQVILQG